MKYKMEKKEGMKHDAKKMDKKASHADSASVKKGHHELHKHHKKEAMHHEKMAKMHHEKSKKDCM